MFGNTLRHSRLRIETKGKAFGTDGGRKDTGTKMLITMAMANTSKKKKKKKSQTGSFHPGLVLAEPYKTCLFQ